MKQPPSKLNNHFLHICHRSISIDSHPSQNGIDIAPPIPPVTTNGGAPPDIDFSGQVLGLMQAVFSYGGAMVRERRIHPNRAV
jgi:hypothetical protein